MSDYSLTIHPRSKWSERAIDEKVSTRELEALILHAEGKENDDIADKLDIKYQSVKNLFYSITEKLDAENNSQALMKSISENLIKLTIDKKDYKVDKEEFADKFFDILKSELEPNTFDRFKTRLLNKLTEENE